MGVTVMLSGMSLFVYYLWRRRERLGGRQRNNQQQHSMTEHAEQSTKGTPALANGLNLISVQMTDGNPRNLECASMRSLYGMKDGDAAAPSLQIDTTGDSIFDATTI